MRYVSLHVRVAVLSLAIALTAAPAAAALTGYGVSTALRGASSQVLVSQKLRDQRAKTCQKHAGRAEGRSIGRKFNPVACEQPPKSEPNLPTALKQATASALAAIG